jgi:AsmA protein
MKRIFVILGAVMALMLVAVLAATFLIDPNHFRPMLEAKLTQSLGREVKLGDLKLSLLLARHGQRSLIADFILPQPAPSW